MDLLSGLIGLAVLLIATWLLLVAILWAHRPSRDRAALLLRLVPELARLGFALLRDPATPRRYRLALLALGAYLAMPIDLIPDFLPGIGAIDDLILVTVVLRWVGRAIGPDRIAAHWAGSEDGLALVLRSLGTN